MSIAIDGPEGRSTVAVDKPFARVGTHPGCEVVLSGACSPRRALYLHATDAGVYAVGLALGEQAEGYVRGWLDPQQAVAVGPYRLWVQLTGPPAPAAPPVELETVEFSAVPPPLIQVSIEGRPVVGHRLSRRLTVVGRGKLSSMRLCDGYVSTVHCVLYRHGDEVWVIDLLSANGTKYEGEPIEAMALSSGQAICLGGAVLTLAGHASGPPPVRPNRTPAEISPPPSAAPWSERPPPSATPDLQLARTAWQTERQRLESELAQLSEQLAAQRVQVQAERRQLEDDLTEHERRVAALRAEQQAAETQGRSQLESLERVRHDVSVQQDEFRAQQQQWESERRRREEELADRARQLEAEARRLAARREELSQRHATDGVPAAGGPMRFIPLPAPRADACGAGVSPALVGDRGAPLQKGAIGAGETPAPQGAPFQSPSTPDTAQELEDLTERVTDCMIRLDAQARRRRRLKYLAIGAIVTVVLAAGTMLVQRGYADGLVRFVESLFPAEEGPEFGPPPKPYDSRERTNRVY